SFRVLEDSAARVPINVYLDRMFEARVIDDRGRERVLRVKCHDPALSRMRIDNNRDVEAVFEQLLTERGILNVEPLGKGMIWAMRADALQVALEQLLSEGITIYDVGRAPDARRTS